MNLNALINKLIDLRRIHGNLPVIIVDADTGWLFPLQAAHLIVDSGRLLISADCGDSHFIP